MISYQFMAKKAIAAKNTAAGSTCDGAPGRTGPGIWWKRLGFMAPQRCNFVLPPTGPADAARAELDAVVRSADRSLGTW
jgi:hypothetical protein